MIFISRPSIVERVFEKGYARFEQYIRRLGLKPIRLGSSNYTLEAPLAGVIELMGTCRGAIILGYPQCSFSTVLAKSGTAQQEITMSFPTPWNHIEATLAFKQRIPVLVIAHEGVSGGIFDYGVTGEYVHTTKLNRKDWHKEKSFQGVFQEWKKRIK